MTPRERAASQKRAEQFCIFDRCRSYTGQTPQWYVLVNQISQNLHTISYLGFFIFLKISRKHRGYLPVWNEALRCQESRSQEDKTAVLSHLPAKYRHGERVKPRVSNRSGGEGGERELGWGERRKVGSGRKAETGRESAPRREPELSMRQLHHPPTPWCDRWLNPSCAVTRVMTQGVCSWQPFHNFITTRTQTRLWPKSAPAPSPPDNNHLTSTCKYPVTDS